MVTEITLTNKALRTPRAAATAGIAFSLLLGTSLVLIRLAIPANPRDVGMWISDPIRMNTIIIALNLVPFAGIAFLWFIGVLRDRMGQFEDRFFASVFLGSGLLFVAMLFVSTALAGSLIATPGLASSNAFSNEVWRFARAVTYTLVTTYTMRMAAVFTISTATIGLRLAIMPRWMGFLGYAFAVVLLLAVGLVAWVEVLFPLWVFIVSIHALIGSLRQHSEPPSSHPTQEARLPMPVDPP